MGIAHRLFTAALFGLIVLPCLADEPVEALRKNQQRPYDGFQASRDAHRYHDARRRWAIGRQLWLIDELKWQAGFPVDRQAPTWCGVPPAERDLHNYWAFSPRFLWGYPVFNAVPQPVGQQQVRVGPTRWESHPVFADSPRSRPVVVDADEQDAPEEPRDDLPPAEPLPAPLPTASGPLEF